ncbi:DUF1887 family CARF protein [Vibrio breoganii]
MKGIDIICAIASGQPDPLVIPFLSENMTCKHLILLVTERIRRSGNAENIAAALKSSSVKVECIDLDRGDSWDDIQQSLERVIAENSGKTIAFNANGGTKPMAMAAFEVCYNESIPVFYVDGNNIDWLYQPKSLSLEPETVRKSLNMNMYFASHGYEIVEQQNLKRSSEINNLIDNWAERDNEKEVATLNFLAKNAENSLKVKVDYSKLPKNNQVTDLVYELEDCEMLTFKDGELIVFNSEEDRFFANGGWYELHVTRILEQINKDKFEGRGKVIPSVTFRSKGMSQKHQNVKNEFDVVFLLENRLFAFECKTADLSSNTHSETNRVDDAVYKLGTMLDNLGGLNSKGAIVSYRKVKDIDRERAKLLGIEIIEHSIDKNILLDKITQMVTNSVRRI